MLKILNSFKNTSVSRALRIKIMKIWPNCQKKLKKIENGLKNNVWIT